MRIRRLDLANVRNIHSLCLELDAGVNLLVGPNGAGKTAVLEALHLLFRGRSFRGRAENVIRRDENRLDIRVACQDDDLGTLRLAHRRERGGGVQMRWNGRTIRQSSTVAALLPLQLLLPELADLVFGGPAGRRQWLDWGTFHVKHDHAANLRAYTRALRNRNALLRMGQTQTLAGWTAQMADLGEAIEAARREYFVQVVPSVKACLAALSPDLTVEFSCYRGWQDHSLAETLADQSVRDVKSGTTNSGPHRADVVLRVAGESAAAVLSRGQGKALASALRLGQASGLLKDDKPSLFLIDDMGAELDRVHSERFYALLDGMNCQIVATSAQEEVGEMLMATRRGRMFHVKQGRLVDAARRDVGKVK